MDGKGSDRPFGHIEKNIVMNKTQNNKLSLSPDHRRHLTLPMDESTLCFFLFILVSLPNNNESQRVRLYLIRATFIYKFAIYPVCDC